MKPATHHHGFAAIAAIFLVLLLTALGAFMLSFSNVQQRSAAQDVQGERAYWAARAGLEWGLTSVSANACPTSPTTLTVDGYSVVVRCVGTNYTEAASTVHVLQFNALASSGTVGDVGFIERSLSASLEQ